MTEKILKYLGNSLILFFCFWMIAEIFYNDYFFDDDRLKIVNYGMSLESGFSDVRMNLTLNPKNFEKKIILASITDRDLIDIGRWPFDRSVWAKFLDKMTKLGARIVAFDVFFYEPSGPSDRLLGDAIERFQRSVTPEGKAKRVIFAFKIHEYPEGDPQNIDPSVPKIEEFPVDSMYLNMITPEDRAELLPFYIDGNNYVRVPEITNPNTNLIPGTEEEETIDQPALSFIGAKEDPDGVFRNYQLISYLYHSESENVFMPSFSLRAYQEISDENILFKYDPETGIHYINFENDKSKWTFPLNTIGSTKMRWFGKGVNFPSISIDQILKSDELKEFTDANVETERTYDKDIFKDATVFVGSVAYGAHDFRHSPVDSKLPGVYHHMNMFKQLLDKNTVRPIRESKFYTYLFLFAGTLLMVATMYFGYAILDLMVMIGLSTGLFALDTYYLLPRGFDIKLFHILFSIISSYSWSTFLHFYQTSKEKSKIRGTFKSFVSPAIVEKMLANPDMVKVGGEKRNITVMFSDVRDFTSISEKLTPDQLAQLLNRYMGIMTDILFKHGGTLDKYIGDAIVAFWGAPLDLENHPYHALKAGIEMIEALPPLNEQFAKEGLPILKHGIGFNTGDCSVGNMGSSKIFQYTALGDNMNLGARLEGLCKPYGVQIICSEFTKNAIPFELQKDFKFRILDKVKVKGKDKAVTIFEVLHSTHPWMINLDALKRWDESFNLYLGRKFGEAKTILIKLCQEYPDDVNCIRLLESCEEYHNNPPNEAWEGVTKFTTK